MKRLLLLITTLSLILCLTACGGTQTPAATEAPAATEEPAATPEVTEAPNLSDGKEYFFLSGDTQIDILADADPILEALGTPMDTAEFDSCAYQGKDIYYFYDGFELTVNDIDGVNKITGITLDDDTVATPEGVKIGSDVSKVEEKLGEPDKAEGTLYIYSGSLSELRLVIEKDKVISLMYVAKQ